MNNKTQARAALTTETETERVTEGKDRGGGKFSIKCVSSRERETERLRQEVYYFMLSLVMSYDFT